MDGRPSQCRLDQPRRGVRRHHARALQHRRPARGRKRHSPLRRRVVRVRDAGPEPAQSPRRGVSHANESLVGGVRRPVRHSRGHPAVFGQGVPHRVEPSPHHRVSGPQHRRRAMADEPGNGRVLAARRAAQRRLRVILSEPDGLPAAGRGRARTAGKGRLGNGAGPHLSRAGARFPVCRSVQPRDLPRQPRHEPHLHAAR